MKPVHILAIGIIFLICIFSALYLFNYNNTTRKDTEITKTSDENKTEIQIAIEEFKNHPGFRNEPAKTLVPLLEIGMTKDDIESLLGKPDEITDLSDCTIWFYSLFYSQFIDVHFDSDNKVLKIQASAPGLGNDQSGSYILEKDNNQAKGLIGTWIKEFASQEGNDYPGDNDWELEVTFNENGRFIWDSKRKNQEDTIIDETLMGTYTIERGFMVSYHFDKPSTQAMEKVPELFAFWPNQLLGQQIYKFQDDYLVLEANKTWIYLKRK